MRGGREAGGAAPLHVPPLPPPPPPGAKGSSYPGRVHRRGRPNYLEQELDRGLPGSVVETQMQVSDTEIQNHNSSRVL